MVATVEPALRGGVTMVQLRDPGASTGELCRTGGTLHRLLEGTGVPLVVNDRLDVALAIRAEGVHLGQSDLPPAAARRLAGDRLIVGWSVSNAEEMARALELPPGTVDYLGLGPVWATPTKTDATEPLGLAGLRDLVARAGGRLPTVAIGGVNSGNAASVLGSGVQGLGVVSAICRAPDPELAARTLRRARTGA